MPKVSWHYISRLDAILLELLQSRLYWSFQNLGDVTAFKKGPSLSSMANRLVSLEECGKRSRSAEPSATLKKQSGINGLLPSLASLGGPLHLFRLLLDLCSRFSKRVTITFPQEKSLLDFPG